jgi:tetratricopeptide (TPR) repeat protein
MLRDAEQLVRDGRYAEAITLSERLIAQDATHLGALETLARAQWKAGQLDPLLRTLRTLTALNPYESGYHALRGAALQCLGRYGEAAAAFARGAQPKAIDASARELHSWQAELLNEMSRTDPVLRAHLRQNAPAACAARGFRVPEGSTRRWLSQRANRASTYQRPS